MNALDRTVESIIIRTRQDRIDTVGTIIEMLEGVIEAGGNAKDCLGAVQILREGLKALTNDSKNGAKG